MAERVTHDRIMQLATGFWASKTFLSAIELGVFGAFAEGALTLPELRKRLGLHERSARDFFDALVAIGLLQRDEAGRYSNSEEAELFLNPAKPGYMGGLIEMLNARLYGFWGSLTEALRTGEPQNEAKQGGDLFAALYADTDRLEDFLRAMGAQSLPVARTLAASVSLEGRSHCFRYRDCTGMRSGRAGAGSSPSGRRRLRFARGGTCLLALCRVARHVGAVALRSRRLLRR